MCDYSLESHESRPARIGERVTTTKFFYSPTGGFCGQETPEVAVCVLPGTELRFDKPIRIGGLWGWLVPFWEPDSHMARFRQINVGSSHKHHDSIEFENGRIVLLNDLRSGQHATVLQLPIAATSNLTHVEGEVTALELVG
jgi:hypothetical protein